MTGQSLRQRAAGGVAQQHPQQQQAEPTVADLIERLAPQIARALPAHMSADRMTRIALTSLRTTPALQRCNPQSLLGALMTCAQLGLEPGPTGEAYLVPYGNEVTFIPGYRGLVKLAWQSGQISSFMAETIHEHDTYDVQYGSDPRLVHMRAPLGQDRGQAVAWYAVAKFKNGGQAFVVMDRHEVDALRTRSKASTKGPWSTDYDEMAKKSCIRRLAKMLPLSPELATAIAADESIRHDVSTGLSAAQLDFAQPPALEQGPVDVTTGEVGTPEENPFPADPS